MRDLIERLEAATGPDRELDARIFLLQWPDYRLQTDCEPFPDEVKPGRIQEIGGFGYREAPAYTASIDAALTLVPEGMFARIYCEGPQAIILRPFSGAWHEKARSKLCATPALAIASAALRAGGEG